MGNKCCCVKTTSHNYTSQNERNDVRLHQTNESPNHGIRPFRVHKQSHIRGDVVDFHRGSNTDILDDHDGSMGQKTLQVEDMIETKCSNEFWVFGYGSLVWKVDFPIECSRTGYIKGYLRRFYQHSIDHRGTIEKVRHLSVIYQERKYESRDEAKMKYPGRVVTLIPSPDPDARVFGIAYKIPEEALKHLDFREKNGYERHHVEFFATDPSESGAVPMNRIIIYVATQENESFAGPTGLTRIADQILEAHGPSGPNREYVYRLADAMRRYFPDQNDEHLFELENLLKERERHVCNIPVS